MSKIDKLSILGVRQFDNTRSETIQFNTPLTLIVGYNGSGKTTIIECLKYATTGELPPNSKTGGAFIHDPKLAGEKEVLAQVKLSFKSTSGARMVATRSLQLTVKKTTRTQKTLEGQLLMVKDGERTAISSRVAELDQIIPQYLGVSKAILESVIFCHQDDSLWPMSEPSSLKKKFDEIFEAQKYTKAIDNIKVLRKKQNEELGKFKIIEQHAKEDKEKGDRTEKRSVELSDEIDILREQHEALKTKIDDARQKAEENSLHAIRYQEIVSKLNGKRIELQAVEQNVAELQDNVREMTDTDDQLQSILDQYTERVGQYQKQREDLRRQYSDLSEELDNDRTSLGLKQSEIGKFEAQKDQHEEHLRSRQTLIKETARRHDIRGFDLEVTDARVQEFMEQIAKKSRDQDRRLQKARQDLQEELRKAQNVLNQLNERKSALNQSKQMARNQIATNDRNIARFQSEMDSIEVDEGGEAALMDNKEDAERRLKKVMAEADEVKLDEKIQEAESQIRALDERKEKLDAELIEATRLARESGQLEYLQSQVNPMQHSLETLTKAHKKQLTQAIGQEWDLASLETKYQAVVDQKAKLVKEAESLRDSTVRAKDKVNDRISTNENDLTAKRKELEVCETILREAIGEDEDIADFEEVLARAEQDYESETKDQASFKAVSQYYHECLQMARQHNVCRLCRRTLHDEPRVFTKAGFIKQLEDGIRKALSDAQEEDFKTLLGELEQMRKAQPSFVAYTRLKDTDIPALESEAVRLQSERQSLNDELSNHDMEIRDLEESKRDIDFLSKTVQNILKTHKEVRDLEAKIEDLTAKQKTSRRSRPLDKIQEDVKQIGEEGRVTKASLTRLSADRERFRNQINGLQLKIRDINADLNAAQSKLKDKRALSVRIEELKMQNGEQRDAMRQSDNELQNLVPEIEQAQVQYVDIQRRGEERVHSLQEEVSKTADSLRQLRHADQQINAYIDRGGPQQLARTHRDMENLGHEITRIEEDMKQTASHIKKIDEDLRNTDDTKRAINDNLRFRKAKRSLQGLRDQVKELESHNAEADKEHYEREANKWQNERNRLAAQQAGLFGTLKSKDDQLQELLAEWDTDYKDAAYKYKEAHIKVETTKAAVEDLGRYGGALDKAIMKYHTLKMDEINAIIQELWKSTYQGTDVDGIAIRSDNETAKGNRTYNYRVVMKKQDAEMDMRGRCSAGQKVLASIIIRLALAECFGVNCGLIALDEPTTNLDSANIEALARSLADIIRARRQQANFQLIVITHDEEFLKHMQCNDFCDTYFRVSRNSRQKSQIERQSIHEVMK